MGQLIKLVYHNDYWDGPLSGVCRVEGLSDDRYYFQSINDYHDHLDLRIFSLHQLTSEEWKLEDYWHQQFEQHVGTHTNYDSEGKRGVGEVKPQATHHLYYQAVKDRPYRNDLKSRPAVGYFDLREKLFRSTKFREYLIDGDCFRAVHQPGCEHSDLIIWRDKAQFFDYKVVDRSLPIEQIVAAMGDGIHPGWAIQFHDVGENYPLGINYCPGCGIKLPSDLKDLIASDS
jgi:hypothetical protein